MRISGSPLALSALVFSAAILSACGANTLGGSHPPGDAGGGGGGNPDMTVNTENPPDLIFDPDAFWAEDPPIKYCIPDGGTQMQPKPPGGTPECPDDKNREGCACASEGMMAACWPGLRANRSLGQCKDGTTTCTRVGETQLAWGPCMGYVLPDPNATGGAAACKCFSAGQWALANLSPCFFDNGGGNGSAGATSTFLVNGQVTCPANVALPNQPWSTDTITADCSGHFKLCYALKAGDAKNPQMADCQIISVCTEADYTMVNAMQSFPPLPAWVANSPAQIACAQKFTTTGGYGEMSVVGNTLTCDQFSRVFNRVNYCPLFCNQMPCAQNPKDPSCKGMCDTCGAGGSGGF